MSLTCTGKSVRNVALLFKHSILFTSTLHPMLMQFSTKVRRKTPKGRPLKPCKMNSIAHVYSSSRMASLLQRDSTRLFPILLRMYRNAFASLSTQPADVPYAITVVVFDVCNLNHKRKFSPTKYYADLCYSVQVRALPVEAANP